jgi:hypothetical protein
MDDLALGAVLSAVKRWLPASCAAREMALPVLETVS